MMEFSTRNDNNGGKEKYKRKCTFEDKDKDLIMNLASIKSFKKSIEPFQVPSLNTFNLDIIHGPIKKTERKKSSFKPKEDDKQNFTLDIDSSSNYLVTQSINSELIKLIPNLLIEEIEGNQLKEKKFTITAAGIENSPRRKKDGFVFFGYSLENVSIILI